MGYSSDGLLVRWGRKRWHVYFNYRYPDRNTHDSVRLLGTAGVHAAVRGNLAAELTEAVQAALQHAEHLGVEWHAPSVVIDPGVFGKTDVDVARAEAARLGWPCTVKEPPPAVRVPVPPGSQD